MNPLLVQRVLDLIEPATHILLMTDERIDGDTMGSTLGLFHVLKESGKRIDVYSPKPLPATFEYLPAVDVIRRDDEVLKQPSIDLIIVCDCSDGAYLPATIAKMPHRVPVISFDHHATNPRYGTVNVVEPDAASTADLVWRFIKAAHLPMNTNAAQCLLTGIVTDTQVFFSTNTTHDAFEAATELTTLGANLHEIVRHNFMNKSGASLKLWGIAMQRLFHDDAFDGIATALTQKDLADHGATSEDLEGISNFLNAMLDETHDVIVVYRETDDGHVKGSARSRKKNVAEIAERLYGGGGHTRAAGFKILNATLKLENGKWIIVKKENGTLQDR
jgi:bifunctional oligoribonuclease and PAP phosphatase NrnA